MSIVAETPRTQANASKYLTFVLGHESYGVSVLKVREIIRMLNITPVPKMPDYLKGVINLRGKVIPVIDLRMRFKLAVIETTERTCIIVMQIEHDSGTVSQVGLIVDAVEEVVNIPSADVEETPDFGNKLKTDYITGMAKVKGSVKTLLNIDKVVASTDIEALVHSS
jgi:purine-binding chemotaxis protein CheW